MRCCSVVWGCTLNYLRYNKAEAQTIQPSFQMMHIHFISLQLIHLVFSICERKIIETCRFLIGTYEYLNIHFLIPCTSSLLLCIHIFKKLYTSLIVGTVDNSLLM